MRLWEMREKLKEMVALVVFLSQKGVRRREVGTSLAGGDRESDTWKRLRALEATGQWPRRCSRLSMRRSAGEGAAHRKQGLAPALVMIFILAPALLRSVGVALWSMRK